MIGSDNNVSFTAGAAFECNFVVDASAPAGDINLGNAADGSTPDGGAVGIIGGGGTVTVL